MPKSSFCVGGRLQESTTVLVLGKHFNTFFLLLFILSACNEVLYRLLVSSQIEIEAGLCLQRNA